MTGETVTVRVRDGWGVAVGDRQVSGGSTIAVPRELAADWLEAGWVLLVEQVQAIEPKARKRT